MIWICPSCCIVSPSTCNPIGASLISVTPHCICLLNFIRLNQVLDEKVHVLNIPGGLTTRWEAISDQQNGRLVVLIQEDIVRHNAPMCLDKMCTSHNGWNHINDQYNLALSGTVRSAILASGTMVLWVNSFQHQECKGIITLMLPSTNTSITGKSQ